MNRLNPNAQSFVPEPQANTAQAGPFRPPRRAHAALDHGPLPDLRNPAETSMQVDMPAPRSLLPHKVPDKLVPHKVQDRLVRTPEELAKFPHLIRDSVAADVLPVATMPARQQAWDERRLSPLDTQDQTAAALQRHWGQFVQTVEHAAVSDESIDHLMLPRPPIRRFALTAGSAHWQPPARLPDQGAESIVNDGLSDDEADEPPRLQAKSPQSIAFEARHKQLVTQGRQANPTDVQTFLQDFTEYAMRALTDLAGASSALEGINFSAVLSSPRDGDHNPRKVVKRLDRHAADWDSASRLFASVQTAARELAPQSERAASMAHFIDQCASNANRLYTRSTILKGLHTLPRPCLADPPTHETAATFRHREPLFKAARLFDTARAQCEALRFKNLPLNLFPIQDFDKQWDNLQQNLQAALASPRRPAEQKAFRQACADLMQSTHALRAALHGRPAAPSLEEVTDHLQALALPGQPAIPQLPEAAGGAAADRPATHRPASVPSKPTYKDSLRLGAAVGRQASGNLTAPPHPATPPGADTEWTLVQPGKGRRLQTAAGHQDQAIDPRPATAKAAAAGGQKTATVEESLRPYLEKAAAFALHARGSGVRPGDDPSLAQHVQQLADWCGTWQAYEQCEHALNQCRKDGLGKESEAFLASAQDSIQAGRKTAGAQIEGAIKATFNALQQQGRAIAWIEASAPADGAARYAALADQLDDFQTQLQACSRLKLAAPVDVHLKLCTAARKACAVLAQVLGEPITDSASAVRQSWQLESAMAAVTSAQGKHSSQLKPLLDRCEQQRVITAQAGIDLEAEEMFHFTEKIQNELSELLPPWDEWRHIQNLVQGDPLPAESAPETPRETTPEDLETARLKAAHVGRLKEVAATAHSKIEGFSTPLPGAAGNQRNLCSWILRKVELNASISAEIISSIAEFAGQPAAERIDCARQLAGKFSRLKNECQKAVTALEAQTRTAGAADRSDPIAAQFRRVDFNIRQLSRDCTRAATSFKAVQLLLQGRKSVQDYCKEIENRGMAVDAQHIFSHPNYKKAEDVIIENIKSDLNELKVERWPSSCSNEVEQERHSSDQILNSIGQQLRLEHSVASIKLFIKFVETMVKKQQENKLSDLWLADLIKGGSHILDLGIKTNKIVFTSVKNGGPQPDRSLLHSSVTVLNPLKEAKQTVERLFEERSRSAPPPTAQTASAAGPSRQAGKGRRRR